MELRGVTGAPYKTPRVQKAMPAPFARPSISVGGAQVRRKWRQFRIMELNEGDVIPQFGRIAKTEDVVRRDPHEYFRAFYNGAGEKIVYRVSDSILAFACDD